MFGKFVNLVLLIFLTIMLAVCNSNGEINVNGSENGGMIELEQGQTLIITLDSNVTTGFGWELQSLDESLLKMQGEPEYVPVKPIGPGSGGVEIFRFQALRSGETTLILVYRRTSNNDEPPADTFKLKVVIK